MAHQFHYQHTQRSPLCVSIYATVAAIVALGWFVPASPTTTYVIFAAAGTIFLLGLGFHHLTVADEGDVLGIRFGPLPLFSTVIRYDEITAVEADRTTLMEGWGIHKSFRGGWVWNIWGRDCVMIQHAHITRVGTDDVDNLVAFLRQRSGCDNEIEKK